MKPLFACRLLAACAGVTFGIVARAIAQPALESALAQRLTRTGEIMLPSQFFHETGIQSLQIGLCTGGLSWAAMLLVVEIVNARRPR